MLLSGRFHRAAMLALTLVCVFAGLTALPSGMLAAEAESMRIVINKKTNELGYFKDGELIRTFDVATGRKPSYTPEGTFEIVNKIKNRPYYTDNIPGGDPRNPLGDRWLGLDARDTPGTTYAIHGNNDPDSIGTYASAGCIRMYNDDVHWLYDEVKVGTKVTIATSSLSLEAIAAENGYATGKTFKGKLVVDGHSVKLTRELVEYRGRVYVPLREGFQLLGGKVHWDAKTGLITIDANGRVITYMPGEETAVVDGKVHAVTPSRKQDGAVMMALRDIGRLAGWQVAWDGEAKAVILTGKP